MLAVTPEREWVACFRGNELYKLFFIIITIQSVCLLCAQEKRGTCTFCIYYLTNKDRSLQVYSCIPALCLRYAPPPKKTEVINTNHVFFTIWPNWKNSSPWCHNMYMSIYRILCWSIPLTDIHFVSYLTSDKDQFKTFSILDEIPLLIDHGIFSKYKTEFKKHNKYVEINPFSKGRNKIIFLPIFCCSSFSYINEIRAICKEPVLFT